MLFLSSEINFSKHSLRHTTRVSKGLDPDHDWRSIGPDLGSSCFQRSSIYKKIASCKERVRVVGSGGVQVTDSHFNIFHAYVPGI